MLSHKMKSIQVGIIDPFGQCHKDTELGTFSCIAKARVTPSKTSALETEQEFEAKDETEKYRAAPYTLPWS